MGPIKIRDTSDEQRQREYATVTRSDIYHVERYTSPTPPREDPLSCSALTSGSLTSLVKDGHFASVTDIVLLLYDPATPRLHDHKAYEMYGLSGDSDPTSRPNWQMMEDVIYLCKTLGKQLLTVKIRLCMPELTFPVIPSLHIRIRQHCPNLQLVVIEDTMCKIFDDLQARGNQCLVNSLRRLASEECAFYRSCLHRPQIVPFSSLDVKKRLFNSWGRYFHNESWKCGDNLGFTGTGYFYKLQGCADDQDFDDGKNSEWEFLCELARKIYPCTESDLSLLQVRLTRT